jgi:hypothetical protein
LFRANYLVLLTLGAVYYVPVLVVQWTMIGTVGPVTTTTQIGAMYSRFGMVWPIIILWTAAWYSVIYTVVSDLYLGRPADIGSAISRGVPRILPTMGAAILKSIGVFIAFLFFFIPGVYVALYWFAGPTAAVLENVGPIEALQRSGKLSRDVKWHVFKTYFIVACLFIAAYVLVAIIGWIVSRLVQFVSVQATLTVMQFVISIGLMFIYPLWPIMQTLLYYDARIRNEGYDIELMAQRVGGAVPASATPAPAR